MELALSRNREYLADKRAVEFTRDPQGLINALAKLDSDNEPLETLNTSTAHMFIVNPIKNINGQTVKNLFSTHPPIQDRIKALENLK